MLNAFLTPDSYPFALALAVVAGLFILEILSAFLGGSILGMGGEAVDVDIDVDADFDLSVDVPVDGLELAGEGIDGPVGPSSFLSWIGARDVPFLIWLVSFLTMFGLGGLILQSVVTNVFGAPLFTALAVGITFVPALGVTRVIANWVALIMPKTQTTAMRTRFLGGHQGTITQGTAQRGKPAEAKIKDRHGNLHYIRVEPLEDDAVFPRGSDVTLIRKRGDRFFVI